MIKFLSFLFRNKNINRDEKSIPKVIKNKKNYYSAGFIVSEFDFESVKHYMDSVHYLWYDITYKEYAVPSIDMIKTKAWNLLIDTSCYTLTDPLHDTEYEMKYGGFTAKKHKDGKLSLEFLCDYKNIN